MSDQTNDPTRTTTPGGESQDPARDLLAAGSTEERAVGSRHGMFGVQGSGDTSGDGGLVRSVVIPGAARPAYVIRRGHS